MAREIKFRTWHAAGHMLDWEQTKRHSMHFLFDYGTVTLLQYTGLRDKNGTEIYEGDVVRNLGYHELCIVEWYQGQYIGRYSPQTPHYQLDESKKISERGDLYYIGLGFYAIERNSLEVIGNIYENADLLTNTVSE